MTTSVGFVTTPRALLIARTGERFGRLPSQIVGLAGPLALALDEALAVRLAEAERKAMEAAKSRAQARGTIAPGLTYESTDAAVAAEMRDRARVH